jgi:hypothetical protein
VRCVGTTARPARLHSHPVFAYSTNAGFALAPSYSLTIFPLDTLHCSDPVVSHAFMLRITGKKSGIQIFGI